MNTIHQMPYQQLSMAIDIATRAHRGVNDKQGKPYILHPIAVMTAVEQYGEDHMVVAILHDVIEDTNWTCQNLKEYGISEENVFSIFSITKQSNENYLMYLQRVKEDNVARIVKLADITHNSSLDRIIGTTAKDTDRTTKYRRAYQYLKA